MIETPIPNEKVLVDEASGHTLPPILDGHDLPVEATVIGPARPADGEGLFIVALTVVGGAREIQVHRDQLYAAPTAAMKFRSGKVSLELASEAGVVVLEHDGSNGNGLVIDVPRGWAPDLEQFTLWCCRFLGMVMEDKPTYSVKAVHYLGDGSIEAILDEHAEQGVELASGTVLAPVPEASS